MARAFARKRHGEKVGANKLEHQLDTLVLEAEKLKPMDRKRIHLLERADAVRETLRQVAW